MASIFSTIEEVIAIHDYLIIEFGGAAGLRDMGALEAALLRPQMGNYGVLIQEAAALIESLANNHPFVDGNERVASRSPTRSSALMATTLIATGSRPRADDGDVRQPHLPLCPIQLMAGRKCATNCRTLVTYLPRAGQITLGPF